MSIELTINVSFCVSASGDLDSSKANIVFEFNPFKLFGNTCRIIENKHAELNLDPGVSSYDSDSGTIKFTIVIYRGSSSYRRLCMKELSVKSACEAVKEKLGEMLYIKTRDIRDFSDYFDIHTSNEIYGWEFCIEATYRIEKISWRSR